jgi:hypothetical protein
MRFPGKRPFFIKDIEIKDIEAKRCGGDELLSAVTLALWLTGHARRRSCPPLRNSIDLRLSLR